MLAHPTLDQLNALGLYGLAKGFKELEHKPEARGLDHADTLQDRKNLAIVLSIESDFSGAEKVLQEGIDFETGILGPENKDVIEFREILARRATDARPDAAPVRRCGAGDRGFHR